MFSFIECRYRSVKSNHIINFVLVENPRKHVWSFASAGQPGSSRFPCPDFSGAAPPSFVGKDCFCAFGVEPEFTSDRENALLF